MTAITRVIHKVRVTNPANGAWVQVVVVDETAIIGPNGQEDIYVVSPAGAVPYIFDTTGDLGTQGNSAQCSRVSYLRRLTGSADPSQMLDAEVLTGFAARGPNGIELGLTLAQGSAGALIIDTTGNGLGVDPGMTATSRALHVAAIYEQSDGTSTNTDSGGSTAGGTGRFLLTEKSDAVACRGPNGNEYAIVAPDSAAFVRDITAYTTDAAGNQVPPENADPNHYVVWPAESAGPWLGAGVPSAQGPLWWIEKASSPVSGTIAIHIIGETSNTVQTPAWDGNLNEPAPGTVLPGSTSPGGSAPPGPPLCTQYLTTATVEILGYVNGIEAFSLAQTVALPALWAAVSDRVVGAPATLSGEVSAISYENPAAGASLGSYESSGLAVAVTLDGYACSGFGSFWDLGTNFDIGVLFYWYSLLYYLADTAFPSITTTVTFTLPAQVTVAGKKYNVTGITPSGTASGGTLGGALYLVPLP